MIMHRATVLRLVTFTYLSRDDCEHFISTVSLHASSQDRPESVNLHILTCHHQPSVIYPIVRSPVRNVDSIELYLYQKKYILHIPTYMYDIKCRFVLLAMASTCVGIRQLLLRSQIISMCSFENFLGIV